MTQLYVEQANKTQEQNKPPPFFAAKSLEAASGDRLFYVGLPFFSGRQSGLKTLASNTIDWFTDGDCGEKLNAAVGAGGVPTVRICAADVALSPASSVTVNSTE